MLDYRRAQHELAHFKPNSVTGKGAGGGFATHTSSQPPAIRAG
jgi:hypothetical protein